MSKINKAIAALSVVASLGVSAAPMATFADPMPVSDQHEDQLVLTVLPSCTFGSSRKSGTPFPGGIQHDDSTGGYAADGTSAGQAETRSATAWNETATTESSNGTDEGGHNDDDVASTGYGILNGESGVNATNNLSNSSKHTVHRSMLAGTSTDTFAQTTMTVVCNNGDGYSITATATSLSDGAAQTPKTIPVNGSYSTTSSGYTLKTIDVEASNGMTEASNVEALDAYSDTLIASRSGVSKEAGDTLTVTYGVGVAASQEADTYAGTVTYKLYKGVNGAGA